MSCNNKHDFPFATTVVGEVKDSFMASVGFENGKYLKLGLFALWGVILNFTSFLILHLNFKICI